MVKYLSLHSDIKSWKLPLIALSNEHLLFVMILDIINERNLLKLHIMQEYKDSNKNSYYQDNDINKILSITQSNWLQIFV